MVGDLEHKREIQRRYYRRNREKVLAKNKVRRDPRKKLFTIANKGGGFTKDITVLMVEVEKCDVLCANCHRILHAQELDGRNF